MINIAHRVSLFIWTSYHDRKKTTYLQHVDQEGVLYTVYATWTELDIAQSNIYTALYYLVYE